MYCNSLQFFRNVNKPLPKIGMETCTVPEIKYVEKVFQKFNLNFRKLYSFLLRST